MNIAVIKAEYAHLIQAFVADDVSRPSLSGFRVEPHPSGGTVIVASDVFRLAVFHDEDGRCDAPVLVKLDKETVSACKGRPTWGERYLVVTGSTARVVLAEDRAEAADIAAAGDRPAHVMATQENALIGDFAFPDWRRFCPSELPKEVPVGTFNAKYLAAFAKVSASSGDKAAPVRLYPRKGKGGLFGAGATVVLTARRDFYGVLMPMRDDCALTHIPAFMNGLTAAETEAAE